MEQEKMSPVMGLKEYEKPVLADLPFGKFEVAAGSSDPTVIEDPGDNPNEF